MEFNYTSNRDLTFIKKYVDSIIYPTDKVPEFYASLKKLVGNEPANNVLIKGKEGMGKSTLLDFLEYFFQDRIIRFVDVESCLKAAKEDIGDSIILIDNVNSAIHLELLEVFMNCVASSDAHCIVASNNLTIKPKNKNFETYYLKLTEEVNEDIKNTLLTEGCKNGLFSLALNLYSKGNI